MIARPAWLLLTSLALLLAFGLASGGLLDESLWNDEAWTAWAVQPPYLAETLARVRGDVHPPLYFLALAGWTRAAGDSVYALRLPSALFGLLALAGVYAAGSRLFDRQTGLLALALLATAGFFIYYTREARMYSLLLALGALAVWLYLRWRARPNVRRGLLYGGLLAALLYTHYAGALLALTLLVHTLLFPPRRGRAPGRPNSTAAEYSSDRRSTPKAGDAGHIVGSWGGVFPYALALGLFAPWLPVFFDQMRANPNGPLALPVPTDWGTLAALALIFTGGHWLLPLLPFAPVWGALPVPRPRGTLPLLALWLLLTPAALLALNAWAAPVYQVRYTIPVLPAGALLVAWGLRRMPLPARAALLLALAAAQLSAYPAIWPGKPPWEAAIRQVIAARGPLEPAITDFAPYSPAAYYGRALHFRRGITLDLSWRLHHAGELRDLLAAFDTAESVWTALPANTAKTWHIVTLLDAGRGIGYRAALMNMIFYRFDRDAAGDLRFRFGDQVRYVDGPDAGQQFDLRRGDSLCADFTLQALEAVDGRFSTGLHLVDITGGRSAAQHDAGLGSWAAGDFIHLSPCLDIPPQAAPGYYHLELAVYNWSTGQRLPVIEDGGGNGLDWGDVMRLAAVNVGE